MDLWKTDEKRSTGRFTSFWNFFVDPVVPVNDISVRLRSRQLSAILLLLIISLTVFLFLNFYWMQDLKKNFYWGLILNAILLVCYFLSRLSLYIFASIISLIVLFTGIFGSPVFNNTALSYIFIVAVPVLLFTMHISLRGVVRLLGCCAIGIMGASIVLTQYGITVSPLPISLFITMSTLVLVSIYHRDKIEGEQKEKLVQTKNATIFALAYQAELRDHQTGKHLERTSNYVRLLAQELRQDAAYRDYLNDSYILDLVKASLLHDIGKVAIPDAILHKKGKLTNEEFEEIKKHCFYGTLVLQKAEEKLSFQSFFDIAIQITYSHHERWDGSGYPRGLTGESIALSARIMTLADVYDALRSQRVYKRSYNHDTCCEIIDSEREKHFDPMIVDAFMKCRDDFEDISNTLADAPVQYDN